MMKVVGRSKIETAQGGNGLTVRDQVVELATVCLCSGNASTTSLVWSEGTRQVPPNPTEGRTPFM